MNSNIGNIEKVKNADYIQRVNSKYLGIKIDSNSFDFKSNTGCIKLLIASDKEGESNLFIDLDLGSMWLFLFSEIIKIHNNPKRNYFNRWILDAKKFKNEHSFNIKLSTTDSENLLLIIEEFTTNSNGLQKVQIVFDRCALFNFVNMIIEAVQQVKNFKFSIKNIENEKMNLSIAKISKKSGTIINTANGIDFEEPYLNESDKAQIRYSAINRILRGRWLSVRAERINISSYSIITTIDAEYLLDVDEKVNSSFVALVILSSVCFKEDINE